MIYQEDLMQLKMEQLRERKQSKTWKTPFEAYILLDWYMLRVYWLGIKIENKVVVYIGMILSYR